MAPAAIGPVMLPSYDNVPKSGCWSFTIAEGTSTDHLALNYFPSAPNA
jgi:hypothetical protein